VNATTNSVCGGHFDHGLISANRTEDMQKGGYMLKRCFVFTAVCLMFAGSAAAQHWSDAMLTTNVPFDFVVSGTTLPAGNYVVKTYTEAVLMIQNRDNPEYSKMLTNTDFSLSPSSTRQGTSLVFVRTDGQHVLHQIRFAGDNHTHDIVHGSDVPELVAKY
jgi:hypothetical protein